MEEISVSEELHITKETTASDTVEQEPISETPETDKNTTSSTPEETGDSKDTTVPPVQDIPPVSENGRIFQTGHFFNFRSKKDAFSRDQWILSHIAPDSLMDYLRLEQKRLELLQAQKETREKRLLTAFELTVSLIAVIAVIWLLKDNPIILVNILYIIGIICAVWFWKKPNKK